MTVLLTLRGSLESYRIDEDFASAINGIQLAGAKGQEFLVTKTEGGDGLVVAIPQILTLQEIDD